MVCVGWPDGHRGSVKGPEMDRRHFLAIVVIGVCCGACVNIDKPAAVAGCAFAHNCSDNINNDAATSSGKDAAAPDGNSLDSPDAVAPSLLDTSRSDQSPGLTDAAQDATSTEPGTEIGPEVSFVPGPEPQQGTEARTEPGPEPGMRPEPGPEPGSGTEPGPEPGAEPVPELAPEPRAEPGAEPRPEPGLEPGPEAGPEPRPEPGPEPGPEPPPDAGAVACPSGGICDDFEDGNYSANPAWTVPGSYAVVTDGSKVLAYTGTDTPAVALVGSKATALTIKAKVKATTFPAASNSNRVGLFARADSQGTPSAWYGFTITGDGSLRLQTTDSTPSGCDAVGGAVVAGTWYILTLTVGGTVASTTLEGRLTDTAGGNAKTIGPCTVANGLAAGWTGVGVRGAGTQGEWDDVQITGITP